MKKNKNCLTCGLIFYKKVNMSKKYWVTAKYCSRSCINTGRISPFKGITNRWSEDFKKNLSEKLLNKTCNTGRTHIKKGQRLSKKTEFGNKPAWNKGKENPYFKGEKNPNWKGGITSENHKIRTSTKYKEVRTECFKRDNYTCTKCFKRPKSGEKIILNAHHIKPFSTHPKLRLDINNLITVCIDCHKDIHSK